MLCYYIRIDGYLGAQGQTDFNGVASADWSGHEIGIAGISTGTSTTDNYGVKGHANFVRVRGEYSEDPDTFQGSATYYSYLFTEGDLNRGIRIRNHADAAIKL